MRVNTRVSGRAVKLEDFEKEIVMQLNRMYAWEDQGEWDFKKSGMVTLEHTDIYKSVSGHFNGVSTKSVQIVVVGLLLEY